VTIHDVVIIGSGPAGYTAAIYLARAGLHPIVVTSSVEPGGALTTTTEVENFPGFPAGIQGPILMDNIAEQAEKFGAELLYDDVVAAELTGEVKTVTLGDGTVLNARAVILATGAAHRHLDVPGEERLSGHGVSYCATCDGFFFKGQNLAVIGGGDTALEEALFLTRFAETVTVIHRRDEFRASKIMAERVLNHPKIRVLWNTAVNEIIGGNSVTGLEVRDTATGEISNVGATGIFIAIGHTPRSDLFTGQVSVSATGHVVVQHPTTQTGLAGVFACGDLVDDRYRQAVTAAGTGCAAALDAERYLAALDA
jgi:thioredoxin reductase (NADPH)